MYGYRCPANFTAKHKTSQKCCLTETKVITWRGIKVDLLCLVQALQSEPVIFVPRCITHSHQLSARAILEVAKVLTLLWVHHAVILRHDKHQFLKRLKVAFVDWILVPWPLNLIVDEWQEMTWSSVCLQIGSVPEIVGLCQMILHKRRIYTHMWDDRCQKATEPRCQWTVWHPIHTHQNTMYRQEGVHRWIIVLVDVAPDDLNFSCVCGLLRNSWHVDLSGLHASKDRSTEIYKIMQKYWNLPIEKRCCPVRILERWIHDATRNLLAQLEQIDLLACSTCHNGKTQTNTQSRVWKLEKPKKCTARALDNFMMVTWPESAHYESFLEPGGK